MKPNFKPDIAILRLLAIVIVVAFHAYGMCYAEGHLPQPLPKNYQEAYEWFNQYIPINVAIPLFVFVSGYLFGIQLQKRKYQSLWQVAKDKFLRLGVPYYIFLPIMMATYSGFKLEPYFTGGYWHLWFLPMLWWLFIVTYLLYPIVFSGKKWMAFCLLFCTYVFALMGMFLPHLFGLHHLNEQLCFFLLGVIVMRNEGGIIRAFTSYNLIYPLIMIYVITVMLFPTEYGGVTVALLIGSTSAILVIWYLFHLVPWSRFYFCPLLLSLSACSFGIYIFHNWVEVYLISSTAQKLFPIADFAEHHIILFPMFFTLIAFVISFVLTKMLLMSKVGQLLLR